MTNEQVRQLRDAHDQLVTALHLNTGDGSEEWTGYVDTAVQRVEQALEGEEY